MPSFIDQMGNIIQMNNYPQKIVSIVPSQTELLYYLGAEKQIVGITKFCIHPETKVSSMQKVGGTKKLNIQLIRDLKPDLIIGNKEENEQKDIEILSKEFPIWMSDIKNLDEALEMIYGIGAIINRNNAASELMHKINTQFLGLKAIKPKKRTLYFIWNKPFMAAGKNTFIDDMLTRCGFINCAEKENGRYPEFDLEKIKSLNPELILLSSEPFPFKNEHLQFLKNELPQSIVKIVDGEMFSWYGSRLLNAADYYKILMKDLRNT